MMDRSDILDQFIDQFNHLLEGRIIQRDDQIWFSRQGRLMTEDDIHINGKWNNEIHHLIRPRGDRRYHLGINWDLWEDLKEIEQRVRILHCVGQSALRDRFSDVFEPWYDGSDETAVMMHLVHDDPSLVESITGYDRRWFELLSRDVEWIFDYEGTQISIDHLSFESIDDETHYRLLSRRINRFDCFIVPRIVGEPRGRSISIVQGSPWVSLLDRLGAHRIRVDIR